MSDRIRDMLFERRHRHLPGHRAPCRPYCRLEGGRLIVALPSIVTGLAAALRGNSKEPGND